MFTITCPACQRKLSVKEEAIGKKIQCPGCQKVTVVSATATVAVSHDDAAPRVAELPSQVAENPTHPPMSKPDATVGVAPDGGHDSSLTNFLAPAQTDDELGRLGKYRILKILGHGGMGVVFKGEDLKLKRPVAIKAMLPALAASASCGTRFLREAEAMAAVEHDHIVRIYQIDEERGIPFMAMEFLKGEPLDDRLKREKHLPLADVLRIGREIAEGLGAAHSTGLIHRDIKPGNIWLEAPRNRVKILDFGLARAASQDSALTQQGAIIGTPAYMAPEQGRGSVVDARCDLFSLGVVLYRMCTDQQPFRAPDSVSTLMSVAMHNPPAPITINADLPVELSDLVMKLLEKNPDRRVASAEEVVHALQVIEKKVAMQKLAEEKTEAITAAPQLAGSNRPKQVSGEPSTVDLVPPRRRSVALIGIALVAVFSFLITAGGAVYYWQTNNGVVRIEINDPDIKVAFDKDGPTITGADKKDIKLRAGEHGLHIERGDLAFDTDKFLLKRGDIITLKIKWVKGVKLVAMQGDKVIGTLPAPKTPVIASSEHRLAFDGRSSYVTMPTLRYAGDTPLTVEAWAVLERPLDQPKTEVLLGNPEQAGFAVATGDPTKPGGAQWGFDFFVRQKETYVRVPEKKPLPRNKLVHIAGLYDGKGEVRFYVNGELQSRALAAGAHKSSHMPFALGANPNANSFTEHFLGHMNSVRISKTARYDKDFTPAKRFEPDKDTIALFHFDEGAGDKLTDSSGNGHHGKIVGAKWVKADGTLIAPVIAPTHYALRFGETDRVEMPSFSDHDGPLTFEGFATILEKGGSKAGWVMAVGPGASGTLAPGAAVLWVTPENNWNLAIVGGEAAKANGQIGKRVHFAGVRTGSHLRLFIDGKAAGAVLHPAKPAKGRIMLGGASFHGLIHEVRVSKLVRYSSASFPPPTHLEREADTLALYHFDEGAGDVLKDSSGNGHHGKIVGAKWVKADGTPIVPSTNPDRRAAEWVLSLGGTIRVNDGLDYLKAVAELPTKPFRLAYCNLNGNKQVTDAGLAYLQSCKNLDTLVLANTKISDAGLPHFKGHTKLTYLDLSATRISDVGLAYFKDCKNLGVLNLGGTQVSDAGLIHFKDCENLARLDLSGTQVSDAGLAAFKDCKNLYSLMLYNARVTNVGLAHFKDCKNLTMLYLQNNEISDAGMTYFKDCKSLSLLSLGATQVGDAGMVNFKDCTKLSHLELYATQVSDVGLANFKDCKNLKDLYLNQTRVSDAGLAHFKDCTNLESLGLDHTKVSDAGLAHFKDCKKLTDLGLSDTQVSDAGLAYFKDCKNLKRLNLEKTAITDASVELLCGLTKLTLMSVKATKITPAKIAVLKKALPGCRIEHDGGVIEPKVEALAPNPPLDPVWAKSVAAMKADEQVKAVKAELMKRNPGFDGNITTMVAGSGFVNSISLTTNNVTDIAPLRAFPRLAFVKLVGSPGKGKLKDLTPLADLKAIHQLHCGESLVTELTPLKGLPLDLLSIANSPVSDLGPLKGMKLWHLDIHHTKVSDLTPLKGMPLSKLFVDVPVATRNIEILRSIPTLQTINGKDAKSFLKDVDGK